MEVFTLLLVFLIFQRWLRLNGRVGQAIQVTKLEAQRTFHIILQGRLGKEAERTAVHGADYSIMSCNPSEWDALYFDKKISQGEFYGLAFATRNLDCFFDTCSVGTGSGRG